MLLVGQIPLPYAVGFALRRSYACPNRIESLVTGPPIRNVGWRAPVARAAVAERRRPRGKAILTISGSLTAISMISFLRMASAKRSKLSAGAGPAANVLEIIGVEVRLDRENRQAVER
jgi:hypothetical protein